MMIGMGRLFCALVAFLSGILAASAAAQTPPLVDAPAGKIEGLEEDGLRVFRGVPYAKAPVGNLRWRATQPLERWRGVKSANAFGPACPQMHYAPTQMSTLSSFSEDCLTLNVWAGPQAKIRRPVMVWIHGGGFFTGSGAEAQYDGSALAKRGVVVITFNYRLGLLGFFRHPALGSGTPAANSGNFALLDQIALLRWVKENVSAFGGDPANVTVFGESAGGMSTLALMASPLTKGLFAKTIVQSGAIDVPLADNASAVKAGANWANSVGIGGSDKSAERALRLLSVEQIAPSQPSMPQILAIQSMSRPIVDGVVLRDAPRAIFAAGNEARVPMIIGSNGNETNVWSFGSKLGLVPLFPTDPLAILKSRPDGESIWADYVHATGGDRSLALQALASDQVVGGPTLRTARQHARVAPTWIYRFDAVPSPGQSVTRLAPHGTDIWYVFGTLDSMPKNEGAVIERDRALSRAVGDAWVRFATTGVPANFNVWPSAQNGTKILRISEGGITIIVSHGVV